MNREDRERFVHEVLRDTWSLSRTTIPEAVAAIVDAWETDLPDVLLVPVEAARIAEGARMQTTLTDGRSVMVRLFTLDEFMVAHKKAIATLPKGPAPISELMARELVRPREVILL